MADLIMKQAVAVIDNRTTAVCLHAAGQIQPIDDPFETINGTYDMSPFHIHCRTMIVPYMGGFVNQQRADANVELQKRPLKVRDVRKFKKIPDAPAQPAVPAAPAWAPRALTQAEKDAVVQYQVTDYWGMNGELRSAAIEGRAATAEVAEKARVLDAVIDAQRFTEPKTLYRSMATQESLGDDLTGAVLQDGGFLSTTEEAKKTTKFLMSGGRHLYEWEIRVPAGTGYHRMENDYEKEILLGRNTKMQVVSHESSVLTAKDLKQRDMPPFMKGLTLSRVVVEVVP